MAQSPKLEIKGLYFPCQDPYSEGHVCTEAEATALNVIRRENLRRGFSRIMEGIAPGTDDQLQQKFAEFSSTYTFSRTWLTKPQDPVEVKAYSMAKELLDAALKKKNIARNSLLAGKYEEMIQHLLATKPEIQAEAKRRVEEIKNLSTEIASL